MGSRIGIAALASLVLLLSAATSAESVAVEGAEQPTEIQRLFEQGNTAYGAGDFEGAIAFYEAIGDAGVDNGTVLFNLGNAYHRSGDLGRAILCYERARRLIPRDRDLRESLAYLEVLKRDKDAEADSSPAVRAVRRIVRGVTVEEAAWGSLALWVVLGLLVAMRIVTGSDHRGARPVKIAMISLSVLLLGALAHAALLFAEEVRDEAIVLAEEISIRSGPSEGDVTEFKLHAGTKVRLGRRSGDWVQVALSEELRGYFLVSRSAQALSCHGCFHLHSQCVLRFRTGCSWRLCFRARSPSRRWRTPPPRSPRYRPRRSGSRLALWWRPAEARPGFNARGSARGRKRSERNPTRSGPGRSGFGSIFTKAAGLGAPRFCGERRSPDSSAAF